uniref:Resolvase/invertase-type recombinase catalytic domain-containing protein n=1 Tax=Macrostomum lignano TaxID=282301 RepID=A0A1I8FH21_9PLAT
MLMEIAAAQHLIEVFSVEDDMASDFDAKILASLLGMPQSAGDDAGGNGRKSRGAKTRSKNDLERAVLQALRDNQTEFAELNGGGRLQLEAAYVKDSPDAWSCSGMSILAED